MAKLPPEATDLPDDIIIGLSNYFDVLRLKRLKGETLTSSAEEGVQAYESLIKWLYPHPEMPDEEKKVFNLAKKKLKEKFS